MASPLKIPPSIINASREELEKLFVATLQKLKARDKKIDELSKHIENRSISDQDNVASSLELQRAEARVHELEATIAALQNTLLSKEEAFDQRLSAELELLNGQISSLETELVSVKADLEQERRNSAVVRGQLAAQEELITKLQEAEGETNSADSAQKIIELERNLAEVETRKMQQHAAAAAQWEEEKATLTDRLTEAERLASASQNAADAAVSKVLETETSLSASQDEVEDLKNRLAIAMNASCMSKDSDSVEAAGKEAIAKAEELKKTLEAAQHEIEASKSRASLLEEEVENLTEELKRMKSDNDQEHALDSATCATQSDVSSHEKGVAQLQKDLDAARSEIERLQAEASVAPPSDLLRSQNQMSPQRSSPPSAESTSMDASACGHIDGTVAIATPGAPPTPCADEEGALKIECQRLAKELTDVKRKFVVATKRMQQEAAAKIAELEARLGAASLSTEEGTTGRDASPAPSQAAVDSARAEVAQIRKEAENERNRFKKALAESKRRMESLLGEKIAVEAMAAQAQTEAEAQAQVLHAELAISEQRASTAQREAESALAELGDYKSRAHALLKAKELAIREAKELALEDQAAALETAESAALSAEAAAKRSQKELESVKLRASEEISSLKASEAATAAQLRREADAAHDAAAAANRQYEHLKLRYESLETRMAQVQTQRATAEQRAADADMLTAKLEAIEVEHAKYKEVMCAAVREAETDAASAREACTALKEEVSSLQTVIDRLKAFEGARSMATGAGTPSGQGGDSIPVRDPRSESSIDGGSGVNLDGGRGEDNLGDPFGFGFGWANPSLEGTREALSSPLGETDSIASAPLVELAKREKQLAAAERRSQQLEAEVADLEREVTLHGAQQAALKEAVRDLERELERVKLSGKQVDMEYFKNVMLKLFETGEEESLLPVVATVLQFSPTELARCRKGLAERTAHRAALLARAGDASANVSSYFSSWLGGEANPS